MSANILGLDDHDDALESVSTMDLFGFESNIPIQAFKNAGNHVPELDPAYQFNPKVTAAILAGFAFNRRVLIQGLHGTGKSSHVEQVAARLNWDTVRVNLDGHIGRLDLVGRDHIKLKDGKQVTEFQEGILPWSIERPMAMILDEYDAGRPDVMFLIQRLLEKDGKFTLLDQNRVITPHPHFRLFATANTVGLGNLNGLYEGVNTLNHAQIDRWNIVTTLNYLKEADELEIVLSRLPQLRTPEGLQMAQQMVAYAKLTRKGFEVGDVSVLMSPRTVIAWAENYDLFKDLETAFRLSYLNKTDPAERPIYAEYYQRCFGDELDMRSEFDDGG